MRVLGQYGELLMVGAGKRSGMLLAERSMGRAGSGLLLVPGGGCGQGSSLIIGDAAWVSMGFPRMQCPLCSPGKKRQMHFGCWKLSPASATSPTPLRGDSPALTPLWLQASYQEALP